MSDTTIFNKDKMFVTKKIKSMNTSKGVTPKSKIYFASKTKYADKWVGLRNSDVNINSTWIDDAVGGNKINCRELIHRCVQEVKECDYLVLYVEPGDFLKCALVELGAALAGNKQVVIVGMCESVNSDTLLSHELITLSNSIEEALSHISNIKASFKPIIKRRRSTKYCTDCGELDCQCGFGE